jgi:hypothetical protein
MHPMHFVAGDSYRSGETGNCSERMSCTERSSAGRLREDTYHCGLHYFIFLVFFCVFDYVVRKTGYFICIKARHNHCINVFNTCCMHICIYVSFILVEAAASIYMEH